ncbi:MAG: protein phosphatase 2C domain-containing protein [Merismopedia sp. SIO2A8]|nr:protein phosphatase 2C domain-containing protein [Merismopedia sp. SIO2A8]
MYPYFEIAAGSVQGYTHVRQGQNNQDAFVWGTLDNGPGYEIDDETNTKSLERTAIAIVCDGCGSCPASEVGAQLGARFLVDAIAQRLHHGDSVSDQAFWSDVQADVLQRLRSLTTSLNGNEVKAIQAYLLFTIMGAVIAPEATVIFGLGDGVFAINDEVQSTGPFVDNAPPYLAYQLMPEGHTPFTPGELELTIHRQVPTPEVRSLLIGSDGVEDLRAIESSPLPGKTELVGHLSQFWLSDRYFKNPDTVRRRLALINRESIKPDWQQQQLAKQGGLLPDDTTLVVMRRSES